ncbi:unnamed protein product [marine sediment metagenome]|uniref:Uncharacterized protein n=1 Tax=marine sediment metagenome TaxID=412755 RepID=X1LFV3_9ZZZZ
MIPIPDAALASREPNPDRPRCQESHDIRHGGDKQPGRAVMQGEVASHPCRLPASSPMDDYIPSEKREKNFEKDRGH